MKIGNVDLRVLLLGVAACLLTLAGCQETKAKPDTSYNCAASASWFTSPSMPEEVASSATFCDFYQFSWQAFAYLMAPSANNNELRNFEDISQYPELEVNPKDGSPANSCNEKVDGKSLFMRMSKPRGSDTEFVLPERIGQAGGGATIYDQAGNVVYYDVRFSKNMCDAAAISGKANFPGGTTELKLAWKVLTSADNAGDYLTMDATISPETAPTKLGLIGMHVAVATPKHPEFVWATFEHNANVPDCVQPSATKGWSFTSEQCATDLQTRNILGALQCRFNNPQPQTNPKLVSKQSPTEICREYPHGSAPVDPHYNENVGDITAMNASVQQYFKGDFAVLANYFNLGALWVADIGQSSDISNQRGSLRLANSVAETDFQAVDTNPKQFISNCFGCHNYSGTDQPASGMNTGSGGLSHIFDDIIAGSGQCIDVQSAKVINNQSGATEACPSTCAGSSKLLTWNGQWTNQGATGQQLPMSVCGCCGS